MGDFNIFDILEERPADYIPASPRYSINSPTYHPISPTIFNPRRLFPFGRAQHRETTGIFVCECADCNIAESLRYSEEKERRCCYVRNFMKYLNKQQKDTDL